MHLMLEFLCYFLGISNGALCVNIVLLMLKKYPHHL